MKENFMTGVTSSEFQIHTLTLHDSLDMTGYKGRKDSCPKCGRQFRTQDAMARHISNKHSLNWEDSYEVEFDTHMMFGKGFDFEPMECLRWEAATPIGRFAIWPQTKNDWYVYGGDLGYYEQGLPDEESAQQFVYDLAYPNNDNPKTEKAGK